MALMRSLAPAILAIAGASLVLGNDVVLGSRLPNDYVICNVSLNRAPTERGVKLIIPLVDRSNISSINITDRNASNDQSASVIFGGVGHRLAIVYLKSPLNRGLNFTLVARGSRPPPPPPPPKPVPPHQGPSPPQNHERPVPPPLAHRSPRPPTLKEEDQYEDVYEFVGQFF